MLRRLLPLLFLACVGCASTQDSTVATVPQVDLDRYTGKWYEIASYPMYFQRKCLGDTTAQYTAREDGRIDVLNRCRSAKGFDEADGIATVVPDSGNARLRVSFFWPFKGDYWIIGLDPLYRWAVVGSPDRKYLWILARSPEMSAMRLEEALAAARAQGYDLKELRYTEQNGKTSAPGTAKR